MHIQGFKTTSNGLDSLTVANDVERPLRSRVKTQLLSLQVLSHFSLHPLLHWPTLITLIPRQLQSNSTLGNISPLSLISPHSTYNIQTILIPILYILCRYITTIPTLHCNALLAVYPPIVSSLKLIIKYNTTHRS